MRRYRRQHLSDEVEEAIWNYAYGCTCLGMLEEFDGNEELYEAVDNITMAFKNYVYDNVDREDESYAEYKLIQAASEKEMNSDFSFIADDEKEAYAIKEAQNFIRIGKECAFLGTNGDAY